jgi:hypothetical protein
MQEIVHGIVRKIAPRQTLSRLFQQNNEMGGSWGQKTGRQKMI